MQTVSGAGRLSRDGCRPRGTILAGFAIARLGLASFIWLNAALLVASAAIALALPRQLGSRPKRPQTEGGILSLLRLPWFARLMAVAALVEGSHALHDSFAVIRWQEAGIGPDAAGLLWSEAVVSEVLVFVWLGRRLVDPLGPRSAAMLAGVAGGLRWCVMARTSWPPALAGIEPLHGFTFALLHLACMRLIGRLDRRGDGGPDARVRSTLRRARLQRFSGDRAVRLAGEARLEAPVDRWRMLCSHIHEEVCRKGFDTELGSFVQSYGSTRLDASLLLIPTTGFVPAEDPLVLGTVKEIERRLISNGFVMRLDPTEIELGLDHGEGSILACNF